VNEKKWGKIKVEGILFVVVVVVLLNLMLNT